MMEPGRISVIGMGMIVGIALKVGYGLPRLLVLRRGWEGRVRRMSDDIRDHDQKASEFVMDVLKDALRLNKDLSKDQLMGELYISMLAVEIEVKKQIRKIRKGVGSWG